MKNRDLDFLFEVGSLKNISRAWKQVLATPVENVLEHTLRMVFLALIIARREGVKNEEKIMKMVLFHDLPEARTLDSAFIHKEYIDRHEEKAATDLFSDTTLASELETVKEYNRRECIEALIVRDADILEVDIELKELEKNGNLTASKYAKMRKSVRDNKLHTKTAKELWDEIQSADPDHWHLGATENWINSKHFQQN